MTRVALFFDGKNHMKDLRLAAGDRWVDHGALARWAVEHVGGDVFVAAHYYTGVPTATDEGPPRRALADLLRDLERLPGFFVHRFNRQSSTWTCSSCGHVEAFTREKRVDTSLIADMILLAVRDAYDVCIVFSGDLDVAPAVDAIHALGKAAWVATFGKVGMSRALQRSAWSTIDLSEHMDLYAHAALGTSPEPQSDPTLQDAELLRELRRAEAHFSAGGGFVGAHYFIHRWRGHGIPDDAEARRRGMERLIQVGLVEKYEVDHKAALRVVGQFDLSAPPSAPAPVATPEPSSSDEAAEE